MITATMSLSYIEEKFRDAEKARPDEVLGCPARYSTDSPDLFLHMDGDNSPLLDSLLEMADKGDLNPDWFLYNVEGEFPMAWFCYDPSFPFRGTKVMVAFTPFPELSLLEDVGGYKRLRFTPGIKLVSFFEGVILKQALDIIFAPDPELSEGRPPLTPDEIPF